MLRFLRAEYMRTVINERGRMGGFTEIAPTSASPAGQTGRLAHGGTPEPSRSRASVTALWRSLVRPFLFWTHLLAGVMTGGVVLVMSATGVLLTYQKQITTWADLRGLDGAPPTAAMAPLSPDSLIARARVATGAPPTGIVWRSGRTRPVEIILPQNRRVFLNAYTGQLLGTGSADVRGFFREVTSWHRWLGMRGDLRNTGRSLTGLSNLAFLVLAVTGIVLWWPRQITRVAFRNVLQFRRGLSSKAREFNWHHVLGFWTWIPLLVVVTSGVVISYRWAGDLVYRAAGEAPPRRAPAESSRAEASRAEASRAEGSRADAAPAEAPAPVPFGDALRITESRAPDWRTISLSLPRQRTAEYTFTIDRGTGGEPQKRAQLVVGHAGAEAKWQAFSDQPTARRWRSILRFAHTGEVLGLVGQTVAGLVSLAACLLVYTGLALSLRRLLVWFRRRRTAPALPM